MSQIVKLIEEESAALAAQGKAPLKDLIGWQRDAALDLSKKAASPGGSVRDETDKLEQELNKNGADFDPDTYFGD